MNDKSGALRPRPARLGLMGVWLAIFSIALLAACSSPGKTASGGNSTSSAYAKAVAYAQCIRAHGIPNYPDPNSRGVFVVPNGGSPPGGNVSKAVREAAMRACQHLLPPLMAQGPPQGGQGAKAANAALKFSQCMRSHGEPGFPDPAANGSFTLPTGMNSQSSQFQKASRACQSLRGSVR